MSSTINSTNHVVLFTVADWVMKLMDKPFAYFVDVWNSQNDVTAEYDTEGRLCDAGEDEAFQIRVSTHGEELDPEGYRTYQVQVAAFPHLIETGLDVHGWFEIHEQRGVVRASINLERA